MPSFPKPSFNYALNVAKELKALKVYNARPDIKIPASNPSNLVLATWNIANLGGQAREPGHLRIIADILSRFDLIGVQEIKDNSADFQAIVKLLGARYKFIFSDASGNNERMAFVYNSRKIKVLQEVAELTIPPSDFRFVTLPGFTAQFSGFDRSPYLVSFAAKQFTFSLLNVHLYFGKENMSSSIERRCLEAYCVARWADLRSNSNYAYCSNILAIGDFNLPMVDEKDPVYKALVKRGLQLPEHTTKVYSNISNDKTYDQIAFLPGMKSRIITHGVFPFDNVLFEDLYKSRSAADFKSYVRYFISDHRPMWMELNLEG